MTVCGSGDCARKNSNAAADKLIAYLDKVAISGICTNIPLLKLVLADDVFRKGKYDTDYLPQLLKRTDIETYRRNRCQ